MRLPLCNALAKMSSICRTFSRAGYTVSGSMIASVLNHTNADYHFPRVILWHICSLFFLLGLPHAGYSQTIVPITSSGLNTHISPPITADGMTQFNITAGSRVGTNLFHSFGAFGIPNNNIVNFLNDTALPTSNILGRVTGGNTSNIFGTIQTTGFGNANLFLMNPAGFLFGPNATVNVGGMMTFTSADYIRLMDGGRFNSNPNAIPTDILSTAPIAAYGFLGSNPGSITLQGSQFSVTEGSGISLVGGNITVQSGMLDDGISIQPGRLTAPGGQIKLVSVTSPGEILSSNLQIGANVNGESFTSLGSITISQDARIDTAGTTTGIIAIRSGQLTIRDGVTIASASSSSSSAPVGSVTFNGTGVQMIGSDVVINGTNVSVTGSKVTATNLDGSGGTIAVTAGSVSHPGNVTVAQDALVEASGTKGGGISIRGKQLVVDNAMISADSGNTNGSPVAIDINLTGDLSISTTAVHALTARTTGSGNAGDVRISSQNMDVKATGFGDFTPFSVIDTHTSGSGKAGAVSITTPGDLKVTGDPLDTVFAIDSGTIGSAGQGGKISLTAKNIDLKYASINTGDFVANLLGEEASGSGGNVAIMADTVRLTASSIVTDGFFAGKGGGLTIFARDIQINEASALSASGVQQAAAIRITADQLLVDNSQFAVSNGEGSSGGITLTGKVIEFKNGSTIASQTFGDEAAGAIAITATDHLTLSEDLTTDGALSRPTGLYSNSVGIAGTLGAAGSITVTTPLLEIANGARIDSTSRTSGNAGAVTIVADRMTVAGERPFSPFGETQFFLGGLDLLSSGIYSRTVGSRFCSGACGDAGHVSITTGALNLANGAQINSTTTNTGRGGDISITARQSATLNNQSSISASSTGSGIAGDISINAGQTFTATNSHSAVTTQANAASGGNITLIATDRIQLTNSTISASVSDGSGTGGNITIDPQYVILQNNSQILAQAKDGQGGAITIRTNLFLPDATSIVNADSGSGVNGTVTIQSPNAPISGKIQPLSNRPLQITALLTQPCAAVAGGNFSSFTVAGRDSPLLEPDGWLASPLAFSFSQSHGGTFTNTSQYAAHHEPMQERPILRLHQIAPSGFLTKAFAVPSSVGCAS